ncbi:MAG: hypothetical protein NTY51_01670 [Deltaproteobacteria bacterium]|nr:hypothetical protein [Deltaproteobacteria bacterium]
MIRSMLLDEYSHCQEILASLQRNVEEYPKGALHIQKRTINGKVYAYPYLVFRNGSKVVNTYIRKTEWPEVQKKIELRNKILNEIKPYQNRIRYIEKILGISRNKKFSKNTPA